MFKRILAAILFLGVTIGIGYALYLLFFRAVEEEGVPTVVNENAPVTGLPEAGEGAPVTGGPAVPLPPTEIPAISPIADGGVTVVEPVAPVPTIGASMSANGNLNYYNQSDGRFYRITNDGTVQTLSNKQFYNVSNAQFDPSGDKAILEYPDGSNIFYDFTRDTQVTLPKHWESFEFNSTGSQIAAKSIGIDEANRFVVVSNPDGSGARAVEEMGPNADKVIVSYSPSSQSVAFAKTGEKFGLDREEVYFIGQNHENFKSMVVEGLDFRPKWVPGGEQLMYSVAGSLSRYKPMLWLVDAQGDDIGRNRRSLNVNTWPEKCTFADKSTVYCAVPQDQPEGLGLQPDIAKSLVDDIYKIDLNTGLQTKIAVPEGGHTVNSIMLSPDKRNLFFTDEGSGIINKIKLAN
jgi:hypothetical protein